MLLTAWLSSAGWGEANNLLLKEMALLSSTANVGRRAGEGESVAGRLGRPPGSASQGDVEDTGSSRREMLFTTPARIPQALEWCLPHEMEADAFHWRQKREVCREKVRAQRRRKIRLNGTISCTMAILTKALISFRSPTCLLGLLVQRRSKRHQPSQTAALIKANPKCSEDVILHNHRSARCA